MGYACIKGTLFSSFNIKCVGIYIYTYKNKIRSFLGGPVVKTLCFQHRALVWPLIRERSTTSQHLPRCSAVAKLSDSATPWTSGFPVLHCLQEFAQTHVHWVGDATCLLSLQGLTPMLLQLLTFSTPAEGVQGGEQKWGTLFLERWGRELAGQDFR